MEKELLNELRSAIEVCKLAKISGGTWIRGNPTVGSAF